MAGPLRTLLRATLRAAAGYALVPLDQLAPAAAELLSDLRGRPDVVGVLCPREAGAGTIKVASREVAALFAALARPAQLPPDVRRSLTDDGAADIAALVLDGVLEIEDGGGFVSGPRAHRLLFGCGAPPAAQSATARLSEAALRYAQALGLADAPQLSARLYLYGREPASAAWRRALPTRASVAAFLGTQPGGAADRLLQSCWRAVPPAPDGDSWLAWHAPARAIAARPEAVTYKLYVSAPCEAMPEVFPAALRVLADHRAAYLKVGADLYGLLRPDKMVAYFDDVEELERTGRAMRRALAGMPAQGVPFTAALDDTGLLCWGIDPPRRARLVRWQLRESWRVWVTNRLAAYLLAARADADGPEPWRFAVDRMRLDGVDTAGWTPAASIWESVIAEE